MGKKLLGETQVLLKKIPSEQLAIFESIRNDGKTWEVLNQFVGDQKQINLDKIYRLHRPKTVDDSVKNSVQHEYYCGRIAAFVVLLQLIENAAAELNRRSRRSKKNG